MSVNITNYTISGKRLRSLSIDIISKSCIENKEISIKIPYFEGLKEVGGVLVPFFEFSEKAKEVISEFKIDTLNIEFEEGYEYINGLEINTDDIRIVNVKFPDSAKTLSNCFCLMNINNIDFGNSKITKMTGAFLGCNFWNDVVLPKYLKEIGAYCFENAYFREQFLFNSKIKTISLGAFKHAVFEKTRDIVIPSMCECLGQECFFGADFDTLEIVGHKQPTIGYRAFAESKVKSAKFFNIINFDDDGAMFNDCKMLNALDLKSCFSKKIPVRFCKGCVNLKKITLPTTLNIIEEEAFMEAGFRTISLPGTLTHIQNKAFMNSKIENVKFDKNLVPIEKIGENAFCNSNLTEFPQNLILFCNEVGSFAFKGIKATNIILDAPETGASLGKNIFSDCLHLKFVSLVNYNSNLWTAIEYGMFLGCNCLTTVSVPKTITCLKDKCFMDTNISSFKGTPNLREIGSLCFCGCVFLKTIDLSETQLERIGVNAIDDKDYDLLKFPPFFSELKLSSFFARERSKSELETMLKDFGNFFIVIK